MQRQIRHVLVEIGARSGLHAKAVPAQWNLVEIEFQNLWFGQNRFNSAGQNGFFDFARDRILIPEQQILRHLLGDGRSAPRALPRSDFAGIIKNGPRETREINATMGEKRLILGGQKGIHQKDWIFLIAQLNPAFARIAVHGFAIHIAHIARQRWFIGQQAVGRRQIAGKNNPE